MLTAKTIDVEKLRELRGEADSIRSQVDGLSDKIHSTAQELQEIKQRITDTDYQMSLEGRRRGNTFELDRLRTQAKNKQRAVDDLNTARRKLLATLHPVHDLLERITDVLKKHRLSLDTLLGQG